MCLIVYKSSDAEITQAQIKDFLIRNPDGWGITAQTRNGMKVVRGFDETKLWKNIQSFRHDEVALHLRMATHGMIDTANTHPYHVIEDVFLMHNGVVNINEVDKDKSDTWHLVNLIIKPMAIASGNPRDFLLSKEFGDILYHLGGGASNRWLISANGVLNPLKKDSWEEHNGLVLSNTYAWSSPKKYLVGGNYSGSTWNKWLTDYNDEYKGGIYPNVTDEADAFLTAAESKEQASPLYVDDGAYCSPQGQIDDEAEDLYAQVHDGDIENIRDLVYSDPEGAAILIKSLL